MKTTDQTYLLTSTEFTGQVVFDFDSAGLLIGYDMTGAELSQAQKLFILKKLPRQIVQIKQLLGGSKTAKLTQRKFQKKGVSFEDFWNKYDYKSRSSKKITERVWKNMSQKSRDKAYNHIWHYLHDLPPGVARKYAETYLRSEIWEN